MTERGCYCGEFDCPTIAPDEFGETCFHEYDKCEVPPVQVPHSSVLKLAKARAERAEAAIQRVREIPEKDKYRPGGLGVEYRLGWNDALRHVLRALEGDSDE